MKRTPSLANPTTALPRRIQRDGSFIQMQCPGVKLVTPGHLHAAQTNEPSLCLIFFVIAFLLISYDKN